MNIACPLKKLGPRRALALLATVMVTAAVIAGLIVANSPSEQRGRKLDQKRAENLSQIRYAVSTHYTENGQLPQSLEALKAGVSTKPYYLNEAADPETGELYEYRTVTPDSYELCGTFSGRAPVEDDYYYPRMATGPLGTSEPDFWRHEAGRQCWTASVADQKTYCTGISDCPSGKVCVAAPGGSRPICLPTGDICSTAGCPDTCSVSKTVPVQVECLETVNQ